MLKKEIILLPTKKSRLCLKKSPYIDRLCLYNREWEMIEEDNLKLYPIHFYKLVYNLPINDGDYFLHPDNIILKATEFSDHKVYNCPKVIKTTNKKLGIEIFSDEEIEELINNW